MMATREALIRHLVHDLKPVTPPPPPVLVATAWWLSAWVFVIGVALWLAPARPGFEAQLLSTPRFLAESLLGLGASWLVARAALRSGLPGAGRGRVPMGALLLTALWMLAYVVGLESPALEPSMAGKRPECFLEALLYTLPTGLTGRWLCHRYLVLEPIRSTGLVALGAAIIPGLFMQMACMYSPEHILTHHILPIPLVVATFVAMEWLARRWQHGRRPRTG
jgi:hypothetical protein